MIDLIYRPQGSGKSTYEKSMAYNVPCRWTYLTAPAEVRWQRVMRRNETKGDTYSFEVTQEMFHFMEQHFEQPEEQELAYTTIIENYQMRIE